MKYRIKGSETDSIRSDLLDLSLSPGDKIKSRSGSVVNYAGEISTKTETTRSLIKAVASFKNFPVTKVIAEEAGTGGMVTLAPSYPGAIEDIEIQDQINIQTLAFLAADGNQNIEMKNNLMFKNESLGTIKTQSLDYSDTDTVFVSGFGGINKISLDKGERAHVSEDYIISVDESVDFKRESKSGIRESAFDASGTPTLEITGPGRVFIHARSPFNFHRVFEKIEPY